MKMHFGQSLRSFPRTRITGEGICRKGRSAIFKLSRFLLLVSIGFIVVYPLLFMLSNAFKPPAQSYDPAVIWLPKSLTLDNFREAFRIMKFQSTLLNTLYINIVTGVFQLLSCMIVGYGFARFRFKGRNLVFMLVILTIIVPPQTMTLSLYHNYSNLKLIDSVLVFYMPALLGQGLKSGLYIFVFRQFFRGLPVELDDAATMDGCGTFRIFYQSMLPNAVPAILTVFLFSLVWQWNDYYNPAMFMSKETVAVALRKFQETMSYIPEFGQDVYDPFFMEARIQAACLLSISPLLIVYLFTQRFFVEGIERTGLVG